MLALRAGIQWGGSQTVKIPLNTAQTWGQRALNYAVVCILVHQGDGEYLDTLGRFMLVRNGAEIAMYIKGELQEFGSIPSFAGDINLAWELVTRMNQTTTVSVSSFRQNLAVMWGQEPPMRIVDPGADVLLMNAAVSTVICMAFVEFYAGIKVTFRPDPDHPEETTHAK